MKKYIYCLPLVVILLSISFKSFSSSISGASVLHGSVTISNITPLDTIVSVQSDKAVVNFQTFDVALNESVTINQISGSGNLLNNVLGGNPTQILGNLNVSGILFLINPNGIFIGNNAVIQADKIILSTLAIDMAGFLNNEYNFTQVGSGNPVVVNGLVVANDIWLIGDTIDVSDVLQVQNNGSINLLTGSNQNISISSVPLPPAIMLFAVGLLSVFGLSVQRGAAKKIST